MTSRLGAFCFCSDRAGARTGPCLRFFARNPPSGSSPVPAIGYDVVIERILRRSGVSAHDLATRLEVTEGQVAAWIRGDPAFSLVDSVARACSTDLARVLAEPEPDPHDIGLLETTLAMTVDQRLERLKAYVRFVQAGRAAPRNAQ